jgi:O-antigen/teichoic acid export membrane protein
MSVLLSVTLSSIGLVNLSTRAELVRSLSNVAFSFPLVLLMGFTGVVIAYLAALIVGLR